MEAFFIYLVQSAVCVFLYESFYRLLLRGESFHCLNRMVLLGSLFCALLLPLVDISLGISEHPTVFSESLSELVALQESVVTVVADSRSVSGSFSWQMIFCTVYFSGVILLSFAAMGLYRLQYFRYAALAATLILAFAFRKRLITVFHQIGKGGAEDEE